MVSNFSQLLEHNLYCTSEHLITDWMTCCYVRGTNQHNLLSTQWYNSRGKGNSSYLPVSSSPQNRAQHRCPCPHELPCIPTAPSLLRFGHLSQSTSLSQLVHWNTNSLSSEASCWMMHTSSHGKMCEIIGYNATCLKIFCKLYVI